MKAAALVIANLFVTSAAILAYHLTFAPEAPHSRAQPLPVAPAPDSRAFPPVGVAPSYPRFEALERRVAALERVLSNAATLAPGVLPPPTSQGGPPAAIASSPVWTEEQLTAVRLMLDEIELRKRQEAYATSMREVLDRSSKASLTDDQRERAVALLVGFQRKVWDLFPGGSAGTTAEERQTRNEAAERARKTLEEELRGVVSDEVADRILAMVQHFPARATNELPPVEGR